MSIVVESIKAGSKLMVVKKRQDSIVVDPLSAIRTLVISRNMTGLVGGQNEPTLRVPLSRGIGGSLSFCPLRAGFLFCATLRAINPATKTTKANPLTSSPLFARAANCPLGYPWLRTPNACIAGRAKARQT
ncbi:hypothetical protein [Paraburkholderia haematera]|uniref:hypothetical protein n=1 Tax=Paraburkholderia haematera TaxID=2793077 RepID=UPI001B8D36CA|nr:hypothetical protein [Paraburkholderia haematera]